MFGRRFGSSNNHNYLTDLVGRSNEVQIIIGSVSTITLLDTGSSVSTISKSFYDKHFFEIPIHPVQEILKIECADGQELPYDGFIEANINILGSRSKQNEDNTLNNCFFLIVPDSKYNTNVPVLIGIVSGKEDTVNLQNETVNVICNITSIPVIETISFSSEIVDNLADPMTGLKIDLAAIQQKDKVFKYWIDKVKIDRHCEDEIEDEIVYTTEEPTKGRIGAIDAPEKIQLEELDTSNYTVSADEPSAIDTFGEDMTEDALYPDNIHDSSSQDIPRSETETETITHESPTRVQHTVESSPHRTEQQGPDEEIEDDESDGEDNSEKRPVRTKRKPAWMRSGEFVMMQQPDRMQKAEYLKRLALSGMFPSAEEDFGKALLRIVTENM
ncbi:unnamed protein product [Mytilus coruscus]|uniref:Uncharacterized protein n=1 Tax=Mytilus coruscus TaxID=42192 RepID=A0A6J8DX89_MYTCO|nr:unnamed protein product [Mytilus coruscus]